MGPRTETLQKPPGARGGRAVSGPGPWVDCFGSFAQLLGAWPILGDQLLGVCCFDIAVTGRQL